MTLTNGSRETVGRLSPPAARARASTWRDPRLAVGVAVVAVSVLLGGLLLGHADDTVTVWATRSALSAGHPIGPGVLRRTEVRFADPASADRYLSADQPVPAGATVQRDVGAGEFLPRAAVVATAHRSLTEVPLSVATDAVPAAVGAGSVVDVWVTADPDKNKGRATSRLVFDDVTVVAAPRSGTSLGPTATRQVIVGLTDDQQAALPTALTALASGTVVLTRRQ
ncbi:MAG: SAF domain-containing protein [Nocardioidaceae bacterium]